MARVSVEAAPELAGPQQDLTESTRLLVRVTLRSGRFHPPLLPEAALRLAEIAERADVNMSEVETVVSRDPAIAARLLSMANSAVYNRGTAVTALRPAMTRLGLARIRDVAFQVVAMTRVFNMPSYADRMRELLDESQAAGLIAKETCRLLGLDADTAYVCGLLHDLGEPIMLGIIADSAIKQKRQPLGISLLRNALDADHTTVGSWVCTQWKLPRTISDTVLHHHAPEKSTEPSRMPLVVSVSDLLVRHAGIGPAKEGPPLNIAAELLQVRLGLTADNVKGLIAYAEKLAMTRSEWALGNVVK